MQVSVESLPVRGSAPRTPPRRMNWKLTLICAVVATIIAAGAFRYDWPFRHAVVIAALQQQSGLRVQIGSFRRTYFPNPGCVAGSISFYRSGVDRPVLRINQLIIRGSYSGLLTHRVSKVIARDLHVVVPSPSETPPGAPAIKIGSFHSNLTIGEIVADDAQVEFLPAGKGGSTSIFQVQKLRVYELADGKPLDYETLVHIPQPPAEVHVIGKFGPWQTGNAGQTQISGKYSVQRLDLSVFEGVAGTVSASGSFSGILQHIETQGTTDVPAFSVRRSGHDVHLVARYRAIVNGLNGDTELNPAVAHFRKTTIAWAGTIAGTNEQASGKTVSLEASSDSARIQDLLWLFVHSSTPPMNGPLVFRAKVTVPPGDRPFLNKVSLVGDFGIAGAKYPNPETQKEVDVLSARARGEAARVEDKDDKLGNDSYDPGRVLSNLKGHVVLRDAVAHLSSVSFDVPGASAQVSGSYKLTTEQIDLHGQMDLDTELSKATTGVKSFLLKVIQPLTAKKKKGAIVNLTIAGTYDNPTYTALPVPKK